MPHKSGAELKGSGTVTLPRATVTFLFTDIEGSTQRWEAHHEAMDPALARYDGKRRRDAAERALALCLSTSDGQGAAWTLLFLADGLFQMGRFEELGEAYTR